MFKSDKVMLLLMYLISLSFVVSLMMISNGAAAASQYILSQPTSKSAVIKSVEGNAVLAVMCHTTEPGKKGLSILLLVNNALPLNVAPLIKTGSAMWLIYNKNLLAAPVDQIQHYLYLIMDKGSIESIIPDQWRNRLTFYLTEVYIDAVRGIYQECTS